jgi:hypothetical protein
MTLPAEGTLLIMSTIGVPLYSARGLTQVLSPVDESKPKPRRTLNGELVHLGLNVMRKYQSLITCTDQNAPAFSGVWPGMTVLVNCVCEMAHKTVGGSPERTVVPLSTRVVGDFTFYRPQMTFMVTDFSQALDEYKHDYQWQLGLLEV